MGCGLESAIENILEVRYLEKSDHQKMSAYIQCSEKKQPKRAVLYYLSLFQ